MQQADFGNVDRQRADVADALARALTDADRRDVDLVGG
jgi:hypothetical protein